MNINSFVTGVAAMILVTTSPSSGWSAGWVDDWVDQKVETSPGYFEG